MTSRWRLLAACAVAAAVIANHSGTVRAGGSGPDYLNWRSGLLPVDVAAFAEGRLGVVRSVMMRRYLVQAYRVLSGHGPLPDKDDGNYWLLEVDTPAARSRSNITSREWLNASDDVLGIKPDGDSRAWRWFQTSKRLPSGGWFENCQSDAMSTALRSLHARIAEFGATSDYVRSWTQAQVDVFANCESEQLKLPSPVPASAHPQLRADREYQIAAAYFYAMDYDSAAGRFRAIGKDAQSPWRPYGHYLAARALIRKATLQGADTLPAARKEFDAILVDPSLSGVHASARGLIEFIDVRLQVDARLRSLSEALTKGPATRRHLIDYTKTMDRVVGDTVHYDYAGIPGLAAVRSDDVTDWITAFQGTGSESVARAALRWKATKSPAWLIVFLSKIEGPHADAAAAIDAAGQVPPDAPGYQTVLVERLRAMVAVGRRSEAKAALASLPMRSSATLQKETVNELHVLRRQLADSYDEFWRSTPREVAGPVSAVRRVVRDGQERYEPFEVPTVNKPIFDLASARIINYHLPVAKLVDAALSPELADHLRRRLALAAFTRAIVLGLQDEAVRVAPVLARLSPGLATELKTYVSAVPGKPRDRVALLMILRTPGMDTAIPELETSESYLTESPSTRVGNWWCAAETAGTPAPRFIAPADVGTRAEEQRVLGAAPGLQHISGVLFEWSRDEPSNPAVAEALSRFVNGWRQACRKDALDSPAPRLAFETLHRQFPNSAWARRTRFWYR